MTGDTKLLIWQVKNASLSRMKKKKTGGLEPRDQVFFIKLDIDKRKD